MLRRVANVLSSINELIGKTIAWLTTCLVLFMCFDVVRRYLFNETAVWITEMEWHIFAFIFLLSAGYALKHDKHVRVDLFYANFSPKRKAWINLIGTIAFLIPWCWIIIMASYNYAHNSYMINESSPDPGGLPARYIIKFSITLGFILLLIQAVALLLESLATIMGKEDTLRNDHTPVQF